VVDFQEAYVLDNPIKIMKTESLLSTYQFQDKLTEAKALYAGIRKNENSLFQTRDEMLVGAFKLGKILTDFKEEIGHGKWLFWLGGNWPELGERNAQRCMAFFKGNEGWKLLKSVEFNGFEIESVRKFLWGYIPAKERLALEGDEDIKPGPHHLTFVNQFSKYDRQLRSGHVDGFELEIFRREIEPMIKRLAELCGRDWLAGILSNE
jgi:hypothetical protein